MEQYHPAAAVRAVSGIGLALPQSFRQWRGIKGDCGAGREICQQEIE